MSAFCPCGSGLIFEDCCNPYLKGSVSAPTAEALMRSRYSAFVERNWDYLNRTQQRQDNDPPTPDVVWLGLDILATWAGSTEDEEGTVEFEARYSHQGSQAALHEISRFQKVDDKWLYVDGTFPRPDKKPKSGRNDTCPCGSGLKFKKCCGKS
ncbi:MAG: YchJ family metal-binding protein [Pseudomonadota bacterium]